VKAYVDANSTSGALDTDTSSTTVSGTTVETTVYSYTVPGGTLGTSHGVRLTWLGYFSASAGSGLTATVRVKYGSSELFSYAVADVSGGNTKAFDLSFRLFSANSASAQRSIGVFCVGPNGSTTGSGQLMGTHVIARDSASEDSTADKALVITVQHSSTNNVTYAEVAATELL
jgi:hypothetical protein